MLIRIAGKPYSVSATTAGTKPVPRNGSMMTSSARLGIVRSTFTPAIAALAARAERAIASASGSANSKRGDQRSHRQHEVLVCGLHEDLRVRGDPADDIRHHTLSAVAARKRRSSRRSVSSARMASSEVRIAPARIFSPKSCVMPWKMMSPRPPALI